jgi:hypothetical protein
MLIIIDSQISYLRNYWWKHTKKFGNLYEPTVSSAQTFHTKAESAYTKYGIVYIAVSRGTSEVTEVTISMKLGWNRPRDNDLRFSRNERSNCTPRHIVSLVTPSCEYSIRYRHVQPVPGVQWPIKEGLRLNSVTFDEMDLQDVSPSAFISRPCSSRKGAR